MGQNLKNYMEHQGIKKDIQFYSGTCYVHEEYGMDDILKVRLEYPDAKIVSHPECNSAIIDNSDFVGSTEQMLSYMKEDHLKAIFDADRMRAFRASAIRVSRQAIGRHLHHVQIYEIQYPRKISYVP